MTHLTRSQPTLSQAENGRSSAKPAFKNRYQKDGSRPVETERRRSRTDLAVGCTTVRVLKTLRGRIAKPRG